MVFGPPQNRLSHGLGGTGGLGGREVMGGHGGYVVMGGHGGYVVMGGRGGRVGHWKPMSVSGPGDMNLMKPGRSVAMWLLIQLWKRDTRA